MGREAPSALSRRKLDSLPPSSRACSPPRATATHTSTNASSTATLVACERSGDSSTDIASTGQISPMAPYDSMTLPTGVPLRPRSLMIGTSVPYAVVVSAMAKAMLPVSPRLSPRVGTTSNARIIDTAQVSVASRPILPVSSRGSSS